MGYNMGGHAVFIMSRRKNTWGMSIHEKLDFYTSYEPTSGCWLWFGPEHTKGYGRLQMRKRNLYAHRLQWERFNGPIPIGLEVCHKCDTPPCINPEHLFIGTHAENMQDSRRKGRSNLNRGASHPRALFTEDQVRAIRKDKRSGSKIAKEYGGTRWTINDIKAHRTWRYTT